MVAFQGCPEVVWGGSLIMATGGRLFGMQGGIDKKGDFFQGRRDLSGGVCGKKGDVPEGGRGDLLPTPVFMEKQFSGEIYREKKEGKECEGKEGRPPVFRPEVANKKLSPGAGTEKESDRFVPRGIFVFCGKTLLVVHGFFGFPASFMVNPHSPKGGSCSISPNLSGVEERQAFSWKDGLQANAKRNLGGRSGECGKGVGVKRGGKRGGGFFSVADIVREGGMSAK